jgi:hypothetical protein
MPIMKEFSSADIVIGVVASVGVVVLLIVFVYVVKQIMMRKE